MKLTKFAVMAFAVTLCGGSVLAQAPIVEARGAYSKRTSTANQDYARVIPTAYQCGETPVSGCDNSCSTDPTCDGGCDGGCDGIGGAADEPWKLIKDPIGGFSFGGWSNVGYHTKANPNSFNTFPKNVQLQQQWFWAERIADGSSGLGWGGRIDYLYGTDAPDTQAFGVTSQNFDNGWDNGAANLGYGHAMPQLYGEVAMGDLSVKMGRFFTIVGNEVVQATGNFFYSRQFMFYNAEPFTHTGALSTYKVSDDTQLFNGYVLGWDSAFRDNGDAYLGGFKHKLNDTWSVIYSSCLGRFGDANATTNGEKGQVHSLIFTGALSDNWTYISQVDTMLTDNRTGTRVRNTFGTDQYLIYKLSDKVSIGQRFEWFNYGGSFFNNVSNGDLYNYTLGINYRQSANLLFRPEIRQVWDQTRFGFNENNKSSQLACGGDMVFTF